jgi:hypothetical protein
MRAFVERHPESEFVGSKGVISFHLEEIRAYEENRIAILAVSGWKDEFILTQDAARQESEHGSHLGAHDSAGDGRADPGL